MAVRRLTNERVGDRYVCALEGCDRLGRGRYCNTHANRLRTTGELGAAEIRRMVPFGTPTADRIDIIGWTEDETGCWIWNGRRDRDGYGALDDERTFPVIAHRVAYEKWVGPIPEGKVLMHMCDTPACINPTHLRPGTQAENMRDMIGKGRANMFGRGPQGRSEKTA